jgi:hypothetical protein
MRPVFLRTDQITISVLQSQENSLSSHSAQDKAKKA